MKRGEVWWVDFEPAVGSEANNVRPAVIVSNSSMVEAAQSLGRGVVSVVPMTSNVRRVYSFQVFVAATDSGLERDSKVQTEQIRALDIHRFESYIGTLPPDVMDLVDGAIRLQLAL
jgi:mRNA interferase MazF